MKHVRAITTKPAPAIGEVPAGVLLAFIIDILEAIAALFLAKDAIGGQ